MIEISMKSARSLLRTGVLAVAAMAAMTGQASAQRYFPSPQAAVDALVDSLATQDDAKLRALLGPGGGELIALDDVSADDRYEFLAAWAKGHRVVAEGRSRARLVLQDGWSLPIPITRSGNGWSFDARAGRQEVQLRRIGRNELAAIESMRAYVEAQKEFAALQSKSGTPVFAQRILSTPGQRDGLYWTTAPGEPLSPLGPLFEGTNIQGGYHGYNFRILKAQGPAAVGGAKNFVTGGQMTGGFGLVGWPVRFGETGVKTFIVNQDGTVYQKSLGPNTAAIASAMTRFNPDPSWEAVPTR